MSDKHVPVCKADSHRSSSRVEVHLRAISILVNKIVNHKLPKPIILKR